MVGVLVAGFLLGGGCGVSSSLSSSSELYWTKDDFLLESTFFSVDSKVTLEGGKGGAFFKIPEEEIQNQTSVLKKDKNHGTDVLTFWFFGWNRFFNS